MARTRAIASFLDSMTDGDDQRRPLPTGRGDRPQQARPATVGPVQPRHG